jgi:hypothetical protein
MKLTGKRRTCDQAHSVARARPCQKQVEAMNELKKVLRKQLRLLQHALDNLRG